MDKDFFIIDTNNLSEIKTSLYGYIINEKGIFTKNSKYKINEIKNSTGSWIYIKRENDNIEIMQDFQGNYGLYIYKNNKYFCISNSFIYLVEYINKKYKLTLNKQYINTYLTSDLCSIAYSDTAVNEIYLLPRNIKINIDISYKTINFTSIPSTENSIKLGTYESIHILDLWYEKWRKIIYNCATSKHIFISELSGGIDSRISFMLASKSHINLNNIRIESRIPPIGCQHTYNEDFKIANKIAKKMHFSLNKDYQQISKHLDTSEIINNSFNCKTLIHKSTVFKYNFEEKNIIKLTGGGGENLRDYWYTPVDEFIYKQKGIIFPNDRISIIQKGIDNIKEKYKITSTNSPNIPHLLYRETRGRHHFGTTAVEEFLAGIYTLMPLCDPYLYKINIENDFTNDSNLLIAIIFKRYCPELLEIEFQGNRQIKEHTKVIADKINNKYPYNSNITLEVNNYIIEDIHSTLKETKQNNKNDIYNFYSIILKSSWINNIINELFLHEFYFKSLLTYKTNYLEANTIIGIAYLFELVNNKNIFYYPKKIYENLLCFVKYKNKKTCNIENKIKNFINNSKTIRMDIKNFGSNNDIIFNFFDNYISFTSPKWFKNEYGIGYVIKFVNKSKITFICKGDGELKIFIRGERLILSNGEYYNFVTIIDDFKINNKTVIDNYPVSFNFPFIYKQNVKDGDSFSLLIKANIHDKYTINHFVNIIND